MAFDCTSRCSERVVVLTGKVWSRRAELSSLDMCEGWILNRSIKTGVTADIRFPKSAQGHRGHFWPFSKLSKHSLVGCQIEALLMSGRWQVRNNGAKLHVKEGHMMRKYFQRGSRDPHRTFKERHVTRKLRSKRVFDPQMTRIYALTGTL